MWINVLLKLGKELPDAPGYKYYGAAKELPGVRELFQEKDDEAELRRRKRYLYYFSCFFFFTIYVIFMEEFFLPLSVRQ